MRFGLNTLLFFITSLFTYALIPQATAYPTVLVLGDSLAEGYGLKSEESFPSLMKKELIKIGYTDAHIINAGISGSTSASGLFRLNYHLKEHLKKENLVQKSNKPTHLVLELGANDGLRGLSVESLEKNLTQVIQKAKENQITVILCGMKMPTSYGKDYTKKYESTFDRVAQKTKVAYIPFLLEGVAGNPSLNQADGIHPTFEGQKILAKNVLKKLIPLLSSPQKIKPQPKEANLYGK